MRRRVKHAHKNSTEISFTRRVFHRREILCSHKCLEANENIVHGFDDAAAKATRRVHYIILYYAFISIHIYKYTFSLILLCFLFFQMWVHEARGTDFYRVFSQPKKKKKNHNNNNKVRFIRSILRFICVKSDPTAPPVTCCSALCRHVVDFHNIIPSRSYRA